MKVIITFLLCFALIIPTSTYANLPTDTEPTRENLLEDAVLELLQPQMFQAVQKHYGTTTNIAFHCLRVIDIKKLDHPGSWLFEATLEGVTYTGAHNSLDTFSVTVKKDWKDLNWVLKDYTVSPVKKNHECRSPA